MSFFVKHSSAAVGEETRRTGREPNQTYSIGPYWLASLANAKSFVKGFLEEIEMAKNGQRKSRAWWESFAYLEQTFCENVQEEKGQNIVVQWDFHKICKHRGYGIGLV